jgi:hypothetical protein
VFGGNATSRGELEISFIETQNREKGHLEL